jgi:uncharacterized protein (TIGR03083 family)
VTSPVVGLQLEAFKALDDLCSGLTDEEWALPTECPGWSVQDNLAHITATETMLLGRPAPAHEVESKPWIKNPPGANNEIGVDFRRSWAPQRVLDEFREVTAERAKVLQALTEDELDAESWTPIGPGKVRDLLAIRTMDCWVHEQDIRRAVGKSGGLDGPLAEHVFKRHATALPFVVGKKVAPPEGTTVVFDVDGLGEAAVEMRSPRAAQVDAPDEPTVRLSMDLETFNRLCCGRGDNAAVAKAVRIEGDEELGRKIVAVMNFMI